MLASGRQWFGWWWRLVLKEKNNSLAVAATSDIPYCFNAWSPQWSFRLVSLGETNQLASGKFNCRPFFKGQRERERAICNKTNLSISEIFLFFQALKFALALETVFSHLSVLCKFYKDYKLHSPYGLVSSLKNLLVIINTKLHEKSCCYLQKLHCFWFKFEVCWKRACTLGMI